MNILADLIARVEARLLETKTPCKMYATYEAADKVGMRKSRSYGNMYSHSGTPVHFIVAQIPSNGKWVVAFNMTDMMRRHDFMGGYIGAPCDDGFYTI